MLNGGNRIGVVESEKVSKVIDKTQKRRWDDVKDPIKMNLIDTDLQTEVKPTGRGSNFLGLIKTRHWGSTLKMRIREDEERHLLDKAGLFRNVSVLRPYLWFVYVCIRFDFGCTKLKTWILRHLCI